MTNGGIFGPKLSGKTTLAKHLSLLYWQHCKIRTLAFDPHGDAGWKDHAKFSSNEKEFWQWTWNTNNSLIVVDEAAMTINRDRELVPLFTALRHRNHKLIIIGHSGMDLLPVMRQQLDVLYLFRQPKEAAKVWVGTFCDKVLFEAESLSQYEFIEKQSYKPAVKRKLAL